MKIMINEKIFESLVRDYGDECVKITQNLIDKAYQSGRADGAREFAEWLISHLMLCDSLGQDISDCYDGDNNKAIEDVLAEWQKGAEL